MYMLLAIDHAAADARSSAAAMMPQLLPMNAEQQLLQLASGCGLLLFGELHGTREVPALVGGLLPKLRELGYGSLALEAPRDQRDAILQWADGMASHPPPFYARPSRDGRGSLDMLELIRTARALGLDLLCFDQSPDQPARSWSARDQWMARNLLEAWSAGPGGQRVLGICGSLHARLAPEQGVGRFLRKAVSGGQQLWPSLAGWVRQLQPTLAIGSVDVRFATGEFFNMGVRTIYARPGSRSEAWIRNAAPAYSLELWLPRATVATFLTTPA